MFGGTEKVYTQVDMDRLKVDQQRELDLRQETNRQEIWKLREAQKTEVDTLKSSAITARAEAEAQQALDDSEIESLKAKLEYEKANRQPLIDAAVNGQLGQYEMKYYHDLHSNLETRADGMQKFTETMFDKILTALKDNKPVEAKVMILGKEVFGVDAKAAKGEEKKNN